MENIYFILPILIFFVAYLYAAVGHGGASGYLALLGLFAVDIQYMKSSALILNIFVAGIASYLFIKNKYFKWRLLYPFIITSIPAAYIGSQFEITSFWYKNILAACLGIAALRIIFKEKTDLQETKEINFPLALLAGALIGGLSGMIGIGGGILLSPLILFCKWGKLKETAAASALFIFINSIVGLSGLAYKGIHISSDIYIWLAAALAGGLAGAYWGSYKAPFIKLKWVLSSILIFSIVKLIL
jgi:uncharacterized protein